MRKTLLFENVNGKSEEVEKFIWKRFREKRNVSIKFLPLKQWQKGLSLRVGGQPEDIDAFVKDLKESGLFFIQLEFKKKIHIFEDEFPEKSWKKIGSL